MYKLICLKTTVGLLVGISILQTTIWIRYIKDMKNGMTTLTVTFGAPIPGLKMFHPLTTTLKMNGTISLNILMNVLIRHSSAVNVINFLWRNLAFALIKSKKNRLFFNQFRIIFFP